MNKIMLRAFQYEIDSVPMYQYIASPANQILFSHKFQLNTIQAFERWFADMLETKYHDFFMIEDQKGNSIGFTFLYDFLPYDGHCKFTSCLFDEHIGKGLGVFAGIQMLDYLFSCYPLHEVFTAVFAYNTKSLSVHKHAGFREVGILPMYRYYAGQYHDLHQFVIEREALYEKANKILKVV